MKTIGIISGTESELVHRCMYAKMSEKGEEDILFAPGPMILEKQALNTSTAAYAYTTDEEIRKQINGFIGIAGGSLASIIYGFVGCKNHIEISTTNRLMNGNVGIPVSVSTACAITIPYDLEEAVPGWNKIQKVLGDMHYRGEYAVGIAEDYSLVCLLFGHRPEFFGMYAELVKVDVQSLIEAMDASTPVELHNDIAVGLLVSKPPFPFLTQTGKIEVPTNAEKHVWKLLFNGGEAAFITTHGRDFSEAKKRTYHTANNIKRFFPYLQYRTDLGYGIRFIICREQYESFTRPRRTDKVSRSDHAREELQQSSKDDTVHVEVVGQS